MRTPEEHRLDYFYSLVNLTTKKKRKCIMCGQEFKSMSNGRRHCKECKRILNANRTSAMYEQLL
jgi:tRNA(Ile2) C34 agmatinyltransferase TiaS